MKVQVMSGRYKDLDGEVVQRFPTTSLLKTDQTNLGGRYQKFYEGWIIKVNNHDIKRKKK